MKAKYQIVAMMLMLLMAVTYKTEAQSVDALTARNIAESFISAKGMKTELHDVTPAAWEGNLYLYANGQGYVLMSANDAVRPILAYSTNGAFPTDNIPPQVQALVQPYADIVEKARQHNLPQHPEWKKLLSGTALQPKASTGVDPLVTAR